MRSTFRVLARTRNFVPTQHQLRLSWIADQPIQPTTAVPLASATSELHILDLNLCQWDMDRALLRLFAETQPRLQKLTLASCHTRGDTLAALAALPCLTHLYLLSAQPLSFFDEDFRQLALFVMALGRWGWRATGCWTGLEFCPSHYIALFPSFFPPPPCHSPAPLVISLLQYPWQGWQQVA